MIGIALIVVASPILLTTLAASFSVNTVTGSNTPIPLGNDYQVQTGYASGRYWVFYTDGTNMYYTSSTIGASWSTGTQIAPASVGTDFSTWFAGSTLYYVRVDGTSSSFYYRYGTLTSAGTISWTISETPETILGAGATPTITTDSSGNIWVYTKEGSTEGVYEYNLHTSSWSEIASGLSGITDAEILPFSNGDVALVYGTASVSAINVITCTSISCTPQSSASSTSASNLQMITSSAVAIGNTIYLASVDTNGALNFLTWSYGGSWTDAQAVQTSTAVRYAAISTDGASAFAIYYGWTGTTTSSNIFEITSTNLGQSWSSVSTVSSSEDGGNDIICPFYFAGEQPFAIWSGANSASTGSPYLVRISVESALSIPTVTSTTTTTATSTTTLTSTFVSSTTFTTTQTVISSVGTVTTSVTDTITSTIARTTLTSTVTSTAPPITTTSTLTKTQTFTTTSTIPPVTSTMSTTSTVTQTSTTTATQTMLTATLPSSIYLICDQSTLNNPNQDTNCHAYATLYDGGIPGGSISFSVNPNGAGSFKHLDCQVQEQQNVYFQLRCDVQYTASQTSSPQVISAVYSGDEYHSPSRAQFSLVLNQNSEGNQPHVFTGNLVGMLIGSISILTANVSNLGGAIAVSVIGATVAVPLVLQRSKIRTYFAQKKL